MYKIIKKTAVILSLLLTSDPIHAMDPPMDRESKDPSQSSKKALQWSFLEGNNPINLFQEIICLSESKRSYHLDMVQTCSEILRMNFLEKSKHLESMYGIDPGRVNLDACLNCAITDHTAWAKMFQDDIDILAGVKTKFVGDPKKYFMAFNSILGKYSDALDFYTQEKTKFLKDLHSGAKKNIRLANLSKRNFHSVWRKDVCSDFIKKHTLKEYTDFIADFKIFKGRLQHIDKVFDLAMSPNLDLVTVDSDHKKSFFFAFPEENIFLDLFDFLDMSCIVDPNTLDRYSYYIANYGQDISDVSDASSEDEQKNINLKAIAFETSVPLKNIEEVKSSESILKIPTETVVEPLMEPSFQSNEVAEVVPVEGEKTTENLSVVPAIQENPPVKRTKRMKRADKKKRLQEQKNANRPNGDGREIVKPILKPAFNVYTSLLYNNEPFDKDGKRKFHKAELDTLDAILNLGNKITWSQIKLLITSINGFKGQILKNKGGSACTILFNHPVTGARVIFTIHKPHKSGQGGDVLYLALVKRIKMKFTEAGLFG